ncbi:MAG TPA: PEGA domain-containing protein, partial [Acidobacteriota bacterium]|nr:PEGA domain-containing protein [Acidobacteriota bacterium]
YPYWGFGFGYGYPAYGYGYGFYPYAGTYYYQGYGEVRTEIKPDESKVYLDGDYVGVADDFNSWYQRMNVEPGRHRLVFRLQGFQPYVMTLRVLPGEDYHIKHEMIPGDDALPESEMRLPPEQREDRYERNYRERDYDRNGENDRRPESDDDDYDRYGSDGNQYQYGSNGHSDSRDDQYDRRKQAAPAPEPGMEQPREELEIQEGQPATSSSKSMVTIQVEPKDSTIYVDGTYYGTADAQNSNQIQVLLAQGTHRLEVVRPGYKTFSKDFEVNQVATRNITIQLDKK